MFSNLSGRQGMSLFNRRRRPRQAVYASPQSQIQSRGQCIATTTTAKTNTEVPDEQLADLVEDFEMVSGNFNFSPNQKPSAHFSNFLSSRPSLIRHYSPQKHPHNQFCKENMQTKYQTNYLGTLQNNGTSPGQQKLETRPNSYVGRNFQNKVQNSTNRGFSFDNPAKGSTAGNCAREPRGNDMASFGTTTQNQSKRIKIEKPMNEATSTSDDGFTLKTVDKSMKFVTSTIQGVRKWSEYRDKIPLVFEIFATLDSVPTSNNNGTAKLFHLKDSTGAIRCIYWEMDQKLPRMARGQTYRMVGALERQTNHLQCFTIRQAQPGEQRLAPRQISMCNTAMTKLVSTLAEA